MNKNGKKYNSTKNENQKYKNYPFNRMLNIYLNNEIAKKQSNTKPKEGERASYKQEVYEKLSAELSEKLSKKLAQEIKIPIETLKNYSTGKSTPPVNTKLDEYKLFAKIFGCTLTELLPEPEEEKQKRIKLLHKMGFDEATYDLLTYKSPIKVLFENNDIPTYFKILNSIVLDKNFMNIYENEINSKLRKLISDKNNNDTLKNMSYKNFKLYLEENNIDTIDKIEDTIIRALKSQLDKFIKKEFDTKEE